MKPAVMEYVGATIKTIAIVHKSAWKNIVRDKKEPVVVVPISVEMSAIWAYCARGYHQKQWSPVE